MRQEDTIKKYADMMVERMEQMIGAKWQQGWLNTQFAGLPKNIVGREYSGCNVMMLLMVTEEKGYKTPVFATFNQLHDNGCMVKKGEKSFPVVFWSFIIKDQDGKKISQKQYDAMSEEEQDKCERIPFLNSYNVFNVDQSNMKEANTKLYDKLVGEYKTYEGSTDSFGMYENVALDDMLENQTWYCPINYTRAANQACYSTKMDCITIPAKAQFLKFDLETSGQMYYDTLLHEMAHSTGHKSRLNRFESASVFNNAEYGKEELVAELTGSIVGSMLGFSTKIQDNNVAYLNSWIHTLKERPNFIVSVLGDVSRAVKMIVEKVNITQNEMVC